MKKWLIVFAVGWKIFVCYEYPGQITYKKDKWDRRVRPSHVDKNNYFYTDGCGASSYRFKEFSTLEEARKFIQDMPKDTTPWGDKIIDIKIEQREEIK